jgi:transcriptional regulator with XRE-family HTH domain
MDESLGPMLTRVRLARGWSQLRVAELLCAASGVVTVTRNEVSRWEREERIPSGFWLGWLALVLEVRVQVLELAAARARRRRPLRRASAGQAAIARAASSRPARAGPTGAPAKTAADG